MNSFSSYPTEISARRALSVEVQLAILRLLGWNARYEMIDHGYNVSADLRLLLDQFEVVVKGPLLVEVTE